MVSFSGHAVPDPFCHLQSATRKHRAEHGCGAYTFEDGPGLIRLATELQPSQILELGTGLGYTACCLAFGAPEAHVDTIEGDSQHVRLARDAIEAAGLSKRITVHEGRFEVLLARVNKPVDMVFFDGFAPSLELLGMLRDRLKADGVLICANLGLVGGKQSERIEAELNNKGRWRMLNRIEAGETLVLQKRESQTEH